MVSLITRDELQVAIDAGEVTVVDALGGDYYAQQHLPGAIALTPSDDAAALAGSLLPDKNAAIVTYCANAACPNSDQVGSKLISLGYTNVRKYRDGIEDWVAAGLPVEAGAPVA
ncbi:MAG: rhodanese-like domain-containing protein [Micromonosporaceae bacterium]